MDPMTMMLIMGAASAASGALGSKGETKSTYGKGALSTLDQIQQQVKGMGQQGAGDITQNQNYMQGQDWLQSLFNDPSFFEKFEAPLQRQFKEQTIPELSNQFAGMGSGGSTGGTAFRNQALREGTKLQEAIAALRGGMQQQGVNQSLGYAQQPFSNYAQLLQQAMTPTQNVYQPPSGGPFSDILGAFAGGMGQGYGQQWGQSMAGGMNGGGLKTNVSLPSASNAATSPFLFGG
jgi:hypothetical protein